MTGDNKINWKESNMQVFWGEIAPCDHVVQIYENEKVFMETLEGFAGTGLLAGENVIIIATSEHLSLLEERLKNQGFDLDILTATDKYFPLNAEETISKFFVGECPDENLFIARISDLLKRAQKNNRQVRAFGEMVAILWAKGYNGATMQLENLWNQLHEKKDFSLFCAYPRIGFTQDTANSINQICSCHSKVINGDAKPSTEIYYRSA